MSSPSCEWAEQSGEETCLGSSFPPSPSISACGVVAQAGLTLAGPVSASDGWDYRHILVMLDLITAFEWVFLFEVFACSLPHGS